MFAKFKMKLTKNEYEEYYQYGLEHKQSIEITTRRTLDKYILHDGSLDAKAMEDDWFPEIDAHMFLSHSHADEKTVIGFAGYLHKEFGITCFIDSTVWRYADDLLKLIDEKYCIKSTDENGKNTFSYEKRNLTTSQVHLLLNAALAKMINRCECLIFVNTPNSLKLSDIKTETNTSSPWIYSEIMMASTFPARDFKEYRKDELSHFDAKVTYRINLVDFVELKTIDLIMARESAVLKTPEKILEKLYLDKSILKKNTQSIWE